MENPQENPRPQAKVILSQVTPLERVAFYKKTYAHVAGGVLLFMIFEYFLLQSAAIRDMMMSMLTGYSWLIVLVVFMLVTSYAESTVMKAANRNVQYMGYALYVFAEAFIFVPILYLALEHVGGEVIEQAAVVTLGLFAGVSAIVFITGKDFSFLRAGLAQSPGDTSRNWLTLVT